MKQSDRQKEFKKKANVQKGYFWKNYFDEKKNGKS